MLSNLILKVKCRSTSSYLTLSHLISFVNSGWSVNRLVNISMNQLIILMQSINQSIDRERTSSVTILPFPEIYRIRYRIRADIE